MIAWARGLEIHQVQSTTGHNGFLDDESIAADQPAEV